MEIMTTSLGRKFDELRAKYLSTPEDIDRYEQTVRTVVLIRKFLMVIDLERRRAGLSKAELARRVGADPSAIRRLFSKKAGNPTLKTVLDMLSTLEIDVELKPKHSPRSPFDPQESTKQEPRGLPSRTGAR